ncbi:MAG: RNA polymerase sigma factor [Hyphomicrobiaceae bacterium]
MDNEFRAELVKLLPRLERFAYALTGNLDQGDELVQEACARALERKDQWQPGTRLDSWMYRIVRNIWIDSRRTIKVRGEQVEIGTAHDLSVVDGRTVTDARMTLEVVSRAMAQLPEEQRLVIALICIDGLTYREAAEIVDAPIGTVMSRLARARVALHNLVEGPPEQKSRRRHG